MITIQIIRPDGTMERLTVVQAEFVRQCPHCGEEFLSIDCDRIYPSPSHRQRAYEQRASSRPVTFTSRPRSPYA